MSTEVKTAVVRFVWHDHVSEDATWEMPPIPTWFAGRSTIVRFLATKLSPGGGHRMVPTGANGQPAFALYLREQTGACRAHAIHVLSLDGARIAGVVAFHEPDLFAAFGLPQLLPEENP